MSCVLIPSAAMDGVHYHDYNSGGVYYTSMGQMAPSENLSFNSSFSSQPEYVVHSYSASPRFECVDAPGRSARSFSESFTHPQSESFNGPANIPSNHPMSMGHPPASPPMGIKFPAVPISPSHVVPRQKAKRTPTACEECRKRKQKCDGEAPCQACKEQKLTCRYREVSPTKKDNTLEKMMGLVEKYSKTLMTLSDRLDTMSSTLRQIEQRLTRCWRCGSNVELSTGNCEACGNAYCSIPTVEGVIQC